MAQGVYLTKYGNDAHLKVYVAKYKNEADLVVYKAKYKTDGDITKGIWFFTDYPTDAKKKIYFTDYKNDAQLVIYFTEHKNEAGIVWNDTDGKSIQAHAAGILIDPIDKSYWWYGESLETPIISDHGVNCYHSKDFLNWINIGEVLGQKQVYIKGHSGPYILSRPKVVWNEKTKLFVMWFHLDNNDCTYRYVGVATSSTPNGRFTFIDSFQPDGIPSLDMTLYEDKKNGTVNGVYFVRSCNNKYVGISKLTEDYLNTTGITSIISYPREGHAIFYRNNRYYMMTSHLTGWYPNAADLFISDQDNLDGAKWISLGNPTNSTTTFNSQSTFVLPYPSTKYPGTFFYIYMGDRWDPPGLINATYIWLPYHFHSDTNVTLQWIDKWALTDY